MQSQWHQSSEEFFYNLRKLVIAIENFFTKDAIVLWERFRINFILQNPEKHLSDVVSIRIRQDTDLKKTAWALLDLIDRHQIPHKPRKTEPTSFLEWIELLLDHLHMLFLSTPQYVQDVQIEIGEICFIIPCVQPVPFFAQKHGFKHTDTCFAFEITRQTDPAQILESLKKFHDDLIFYTHHIPSN